MWALKYLVCLFRNHAFAAITAGRAEYHYCLRCGKIEALRYRPVRVAVTVEAGHD